MAVELTGSKSLISGEAKRPRHTIATEKIERLGMQFGGEGLLRKTVSQIAESIAKAPATDEES
jgi:hypothetical protein